MDVGTNSVKVLVADVGEDGVHPIWEKSRQTRLGSNLYATGLLSTESMAATHAAVAEFAVAARARGALSLRIIATSAAREARNASELVQLLADASGVTPEVISGEQEARWAFEGVTSRPGLRELPLLVIDVGGGSTEFVLGRAGHLSYQRSFSLGSVRLLETLAPGDHPGDVGLRRCRTWLREFLSREVLPTLQPALTQVRPAQVIGVGGTTAILAMIRHEQADFHRELIESTVFSTEHLEEMIRELWNLPLAERQRIPGLPPERADVILTGAAIYCGILEGIAFPELRISTRSLRYGALLSGAEPSC